MTRRKIAVLTDSRATFGYNRRVMSLIHQDESLDLALIVSGMHLLKDYGFTIREVEGDGLPVAARIDMMVGGDTPTAWAKSLGVGIQSLAQVFDMIRPDILLVSGDRGDALAATMTAAYMNIPVAHIQSGDLSGHIDGSARHAITKLAHIHFPACQDSADRVVKMGEEPWRVFNVGAPQLDDMIRGTKEPFDQVVAKLGLDSTQPTILVIQHPVLAEVSEAGAQMAETMEAVKEVGAQTVIIYSNVDAAGGEMIETINKYSGLPFLRIFPNLDRMVFLSLLEHAAALVGNSSTGILEAPSYKLPAVNIGDRQRGRMQASNVINVSHNQKEIAAAIRKALYDSAFKQQLETCVNPYGDGQSSERIVKILAEIPIDQRLLDKKMTY
jgi:UDP-N-acetylglucosamine 2-epimerase (non-hydrolysing)/GDP/UDP-N,N'-diacetylbacillosamine 2-epimerase (hydrolysing)